jgi:hypothetical protein
MALARTSPTAPFTFASGGSGSGTSGTFTPSSNSLLVVFFTFFDSGGTAHTRTISVSDTNSLTWTNRADAHSPNDLDRTSVWTAPVSTGASGTVTVTSGAGTDGQGVGAVYQYTGQAASPIGGVASGAQGSTGALTIILNSTPATTSEVIGALGADGGGNSGITTGTGWNQIDQLGNGSSSAIQTQYRDSSTSTSVLWNGNVYGDSSAVAVEIIQASGGGGSPLRFNANLDGLGASGGFFRDPLAGRRAKLHRIGWRASLIVPPRKRILRPAIERIAA